MTIVISRNKTLCFDRSIDATQEYIGKTVPCTPSLVGLFLINQNYSKLSDVEKLSIFDGQNLRIKSILIKEARISHNKETSFNGFSL